MAVINKINVGGQDYDLGSVNVDQTLSGIMAKTDFTDSDVPNSSVIKELNSDLIKTSGDPVTASATPRDADSVGGTYTKATFDTCIRHTAGMNEATPIPRDADTLGGTYTADDITQLNSDLTEKIGGWTVLGELSASNSLTVPTNAKELLVVSYVFNYRYAHVIPMEALNMGGNYACPSTSVKSVYTGHFLILGYSNHILTQAEIREYASPKVFWR